MTPQELVTAAQDGNHDAFAQLWHLYRDDVMRFVYRRTTDRWLAEDITSEVFLRAWRRLPHFTWRDKGFGGWLITIAGNIVIDHYKANARRNGTPFPLDDSDDNWAPPSTDRRTNPEAVVEQADLAAAIDRAMAQLTADQRQVIALKFGAGLRGDEAAALMGRKAGAVKSVQWRALQGMATNPELLALEVAA